MVSSWEMLIQSWQRLWLAFKEALSWLKKLNMSKVFIELDSLGVVQAFHQKLVDDSYFGAIIYP